RYTSGLKRAKRCIDMVGSAVAVVRVHAKFRAAGVVGQTGHSRGLSDAWKAGLRPGIGAVATVLSRAAGLAVNAPRSMASTRVELPRHVRATTFARVYFVVLISTVPTMVLPSSRVTMSR